MKIQLLFFGITTDLVGKNSMPFELDDKTSISDLKKILILKFPRLKNIHEFAIALNEEYATDDLLINENDIIAIIPPVSGG